MKIHKEAHPTLLYTFLFIVILNACSIGFFPFVLQVIIGVLSLMLYGIVLQFFRNPPRTSPIGENNVIAPADGKVVVIEKTTETEYLKDERIQISIFMSPINVHVNRSPIAGVVSFFKYWPGKYLVAWHPKSSTENERTTTVVKHSSGVEVLFRQIAGALARRICWYIKEEDSIKAGEEFGFIKFGSRVDIYLPLGTKINVELEQVVRGGETIIAEL